MQEKKEKKIGKKKLNRIFLIILIMLLAVLCVSLLVQFQEKSIIKNPFKKPELFVIKDECSVIFNNIVHEIKNAGECRIFCRNECGIREKEIYDSEFVESNNSCHTCNCYCK